MLSDCKTKKSHSFGKLLVLFVMIFCLASMTMSVSASDGSDTDVNSNQIGMVTVKVDGKTIPAAINGSTTVEELLKELGITVGDTDKLSIPLGNHVHKDDVLVIKRNGYSTHTVSGEIPYKTIYHYTDQVAPGAQEVMVEGKDGYGTEVYKRYFEDDVMLEEEIVSSSYSSKPVNKEVGIGFKSKPISSLDFGWTFNENFEPHNVEKIIRGGTSTAYTASPEARTASGKQVMVGHVAVNSNIIPLGSKLFIQSKDGKFIYGYAIAADTGGALFSGEVDVDLFFASHQECLSYGVKDLDIFVLETP